METSTQTTTSNTQRSSSPSPGEKEFMQREEQIERVLQNSSHEKQKWYVIFNGLRGIYHDWSIASTHIIGKSVTHKSYLSKEAAEKALAESYKTITTEEVQKSQQFVSLQSTKAICITLMQLTN
ncbi:enzymatic polyprotein [Tanacetum coccineum]